MLKILWKNKVRISMFALLFACLLLARDVVLIIYKETMTLSLNYLGMEKGINPDGTRFNVYELTSNEVLDRTISKANVPGLMVDDLKTRIDIFAAMPKNINERIKNAKERGENFSYISNTYTISYTQKNKLSKPYTRKVLHALAEAYAEVFKERYTDKNTVLEEFDFNPSNYEYVEIPDMYISKISSMINFLSAKNQEGGSFRSAETNETFESLLHQVQSLKSVDVENFKAFVNVSKVYKDKVQLLEKLNYQVKMLTIDYNKFKKEEEFNRMALSQYDSSVTDVVLIPALDEHYDFYMNRTKIGIDYLTQNAYDAGVKAEGIQKEIEEKNKTIQDFSEENHPYEEKLRLTQKADDMLSSINERLEEIAQTAVLTVSEFTVNQMKDYLKFNIEEFSVTDILNVSNGKNAVIYFIMGMVIAVAGLIIWMKTKEYKSVAMNIIRRIRHGA